jgi:hypothetical protein
MQTARELSPCAAYYIRRDVQRAARISPRNPLLASPSSSRREFAKKSEDSGSGQNFGRLATKKRRINTAAYCGNECARNSLLVEDREGQNRFAKTMGTARVFAKNEKLHCMNVIAGNWRAVQKCQLGFGHLTSVSTGGPAAFIACCAADYTVSYCIKISRLAVSNDGLQ